MRDFCFVLLIALPALSETNGVVQNRVQLEDVNIQGEANGKSNPFEGMDRYQLESLVKPRRDFKKEINEEIPSGFNQLQD